VVAIEGSVTVLVLAAAADLGATRDAGTGVDLVRRCPLPLRGRTRAILRTTREQRHNGGKRNQPVHRFPLSPRRADLTTQDRDVGQKTTCVTLLKIPLPSRCVGSALLHSMVFLEGAAWESSISSRAG